MKVKWAISNQHTEFGLFKVGAVIDMAALGVPEEVVSSWIRDGYAVEVKPESESKAECRPEKKRASR
jgi:hypothetical protein